MRLSIILAVALILFVPLTGTAQEEEIIPPANWGELAERLVEMWGVDVAAEPSGGNAAINALNLIGIGKDYYNMIMGIEEEDTAPATGDGYDPDNWLPEQELTGEFMCKLKMVVWAAAYSGLIPYYDVPRPSEPGQPLTPEEEQLANEVARVAVVDLVTTARRDGICENGGGAGMCFVCGTSVIGLPSCSWVPCQ